MTLEILKKENRLIDLFVALAQIPSPSNKEEKVADKIIKILNDSNIKAKKDSYGNVIAKIPATDNSKMGKKPLLLSAHMDVVGDGSPVNVVYKDGYIETDKKRTLGADDKSGVAAAMLLAMEVVKNKNIKHGGIELVFTRDEEHRMSGVKHVDFSKLESEYILVLDASVLGEILVSGASYTDADLTVETFKGGHSGIDIADKTRLNAVKLIGELVNEIPQGVYKSNELGTITSINIGSIIGGGVEAPIDKISREAVDAESYMDFVGKNSLTNLINTKARARYSIRSSEPQNEKQLIDEIQRVVAKFNKKYDKLAKAEFKTAEHLPGFVKSDDDLIEKIGIAAAKEVDIKPIVSSFHAGAETHIYSHQKNKSGKTFKPCLIGVADIYNMHSADEKINVESYLKGYEFLKKMFEIYNK